MLDTTALTIPEMQPAPSPLIGEPPEVCPEPLKGVSHSVVRLRVVHLRFVEPVSLVCDPDAATFQDNHLTTLPALNALDKRLERMEGILNILVNQRTMKDWYSTAEAAKILGKAEFTIREWCRLGRVNAEKRRCGRGRSLEWIIAHAELQRIQNEGLLPQPKVSTRL